MALDSSRLPSFRYEPLAASRARQAARVRQDCQQLVQRLTLNQQEKSALDLQTRTALAQEMRQRSGLDDLDAQLRKEADAKQQSFLFKALSFLDRPGQVVRGVIEEINWNGADPEDIAAAILAGIQGEGPDSFSEVLQRHGFTDESIGLPGFLSNVSATDVGGFVFDLLSDPLNLVPGTAFAKAGRLATKIPVLGEAAAGVGRGLRRAFVPLADVRNVKAIDPLTGELVSFGDNLLGALKATPVANYQANLIWKASPLSKLNDDELGAMWKLFGPTEGIGKGLGDAILKGNQPEMQRLWAEAANQGARYSQSLEQTIRWYTEEGEPLLQALGRKLGLKMTLENYMPHYFGESAKAGVGAGIKADATGFLKYRAIRGLSAEQLSAAGVLDDTNIIFKRALAERTAALDNQTTRIGLGRTFGMKLNVKNVDELPDGWGVFGTLDWRTRTKWDAKAAFQAQDAGKAARKSLYQFWSLASEQDKLVMGIADRAVLLRDELKAATAQLRKEVGALGKQVPQGHPSAALLAQLEAVQQSPEVVRLQKITEAFLNRTAAGGKNAVHAAYAMQAALNEPATAKVLSELRHLMQQVAAVKGPVLPDVRATLSGAAKALNQMLDKGELRSLARETKGVEQALESTIAKMPRGIRRGET